jgi:hypothetical protein
VTVNTLVGRDDNLTGVFEFWKAGAPMVAFPLPTTNYDYDLDTELDALRRYERTEPGRDIPDKSENHVLVATWNIANLGVQKRRTKDYRLIA